MSRAEDQECDPDLDRLAEDWVALWQSELAGLAADPEFAALSRQWLSLGLGWWRMLQAGPVAWPAAAPWHDQPAAPPRPTAAAAASGAGGGPGLGGAGLDPRRPDPIHLERLGARLAELESRLAALEGRPAEGSADRRRHRRRRAPA
jgi:hypothetical protein